MQENQHTIGTANRIVVLPTFPDILSMKPKAARRAWARFMADNDLSAGRFIQAEWVRLSLEELVLNEGHEAQATSQHQVAEWYALFCKDSI